MQRPAFANMAIYSNIITLLQPPWIKFRRLPELHNALHWKHLNWWNCNFYSTQLSHITLLALYASHLQT